jgi:hypothetical protein
VTFRQWCELLGEQGLKVDGKPFKLDDRPAMAWIYDQIPTTREEAYRLRAGADEVRPGRIHGHGDAGRDLPGPEVRARASSACSCPT